MEKNQDTLGVIQGIFNTAFDLPKDVVTLDANLIDDLGLDSIDAIDLIVLLEKESGVKLNLEDLMSIQTVGDVITKIEEVQASLS
ncbi:MAG: acyl carrier protein [SAR324 cluster bacterium]|nr:acyl carrier protein [SAR324 cluster bacterium]